MVRTLEPSGSLQSPRGPAVGNTLRVSDPESSLDIPGKVHKGWIVLMDESA